MAGGVKRPFDELERSVEEDMPCLDDPEMEMKLKKRVFNSLEGISEEGRRVIWVNSSEASVGIAKAISEVDVIKKRLVQMFENSYTNLNITMGRHVESKKRMIQSRSESQLEERVAELEGRVAWITKEKAVVVERMEKMTDKFGLCFEKDLETWDGNVAGLNLRGVTVDDHIGHLPLYMQDILAKAAETLVDTGNVLHVSAQEDDSMVMGEKSMEENEMREKIGMTVLLAMSDLICLTKLSPMPAGSSTPVDDGTK